MSAPLRPQLLRSGDTLAISQSFQQITSAGEIIVRGVSLPTIGEQESKFVEIPKRNHESRSTS
jgi:hypothetical protein